MILSLSLSLPLTQIRLKSKKKKPVLSLLMILKVGKVKLLKKEVKLLSVSEFVYCGVGFTISSFSGT